MRFVKPLAAAGLLLPLSVLAQTTTSPYASAFTSATSTFNELLGLGITLLGVVLAGMVGMKIAKKVISRAT